MHSMYGARGSTPSWVLRSLSSRQAFGGPSKRSVAAERAAGRWSRARSTASSRWITKFNPAAERTFGYPRAAVIGRQMAEVIIPPPLRERHQRAMAHYLATGEGPILGRRL